jgi:hypothetical protein
MWMAGVLVSLVVLVLVLNDAFEAMIMPRRVMHRFRFARMFYRSTWKIWRIGARCWSPGKRREAYLSVFGPLSMLALFATWMIGLILGFALLHWSLGTALHSPDQEIDFFTYLYLSGTTLSTLGYGDVVAVAPLGRFLTVAEAVLGFGFLACVIGYLPALFQAFSRREVTISLLDARAGSPPTAAELLTRGARACRSTALTPFLAEWERWAAEVLESHLSFPMLSFYRSQHDNQSWLAALTVILDTCSLILSGGKDLDSYQAQLTFAMARHAVVDLALVFRTPPLPPVPDRLSPEQLRLLRKTLHEAGLPLRDDAAAHAKLTELRAMYEPFVNALAELLAFALPPFIPERATVDNWQTSAWTRRTPGLGNLPVSDDHFN